MSENRIVRSEPPLEIDFLAHHLHELKGDTAVDAIQAELKRLHQIGYPVGGVFNVLSTASELWDGFPHDRLEELRQLVESTYSASASPVRGIV